MRHLTRLPLFVLTSLLMMSCSQETSISEETRTISNMTEQTYKGQLRRGYANSRFGQIHFRRVLPEKADYAPIMALHLSPNSSQVFSDFLPLIGKDRIAIAPDYPGYGMSDPIEGKQNLTDYAAAMLDVIKTQGIESPIDLIGYHTGAGVALEMARQEPEAIGRITLVAVPLLTKEERESGAALPKIPFDLEGDFAKKEWQSSWRWRGPQQSKESVLATFGEKFRPGSREKGAQAILSYDLLPVFENTQHEVSIITVRDDLWEVSKRANELRPEFKYMELPQYGHGLFHVAPDHMNEIIRGLLE